MTPPKKGKPASHRSGKGSRNKAPGAGAPEAVSSESRPADGTPVPPEEPRKRGRRLRTIRHVRAGLAHLIREMEGGRIDPKTGNALTYAYSVLGGVMSADVANDLAEIRESLTKIGQDIAEQDRTRGGTPR